MKLEKNIGQKNRAGRAIIGALLIAASLIKIDSGLPAYIGLAVGTIFVLEAVFSYCLLHGVRGTNDMR